MEIPRVEGNLVRHPAIVTAEPVAAEISIAAFASLQRDKAIGEFAFEQHPIEICIGFLKPVVGFLRGFYCRVSEVPIRHWNAHSSPGYCRLGMSIPKVHNEMRQTLRRHPKSWGCREKFCLADSSLQNGPSNKRTLYA